MVRGSPCSDGGIHREKRLNTKRTETNREHWQSLADSARRETDRLVSRLMDHSFDFSPLAEKKPVLPPVRGRHGGISARVGRQSRSSHEAPYSPASIFRTECWR